MNFFRKAALTLAAITLAVTAPAFASIATYSDRAAWELEVSPEFTATFEGLAPGGSASYGNAGVELGGMRFLGLFGPGSYSLQVVDPAASQPWYDWGSGAVLRGEEYNPSFSRGFRVEMPQYGVTALGVDLMTGEIEGSSYTVRLSTGDIYQVDTDLKPNRAFFGLTSEAPITWVEFFNPMGTYAIMDNFGYSSAYQWSPEPIHTPEPSTIFLCAAGLLAGISRVLKSKSRQ